MEFKYDRAKIDPHAGFDDPKVTETIENLRKLRGRQHEEAGKAKADGEKAKTEKPKAAQNPAVEEK